MTGNTTKITNLGKRLSALFDGEDINDILPVLTRSIAFCIHSCELTKPERLKIFEVVMNRILEEMQEMESEQNAHMYN
jgi:hypothetical protein